MQNTNDYFVIKKNRNMINTVTTASFTHLYVCVCIHIYVWSASYSAVWHWPGEDITLQF